VISIQYSVVGGWWLVVGGWWLVVGNNRDCGGGVDVYLFWHADLRL